ncbi:L domain-like protein [Hesseltinella vesiculosa]|uniref:L domain-like protein n=1 Tax=Hesseltinella vesiculosa TaxID=101127 RepID=A0A1X2GLZ5_9FUNG|nr:L domain-like protein [Hesseltinella vesiculosa]
MGQTSSTNKHHLPLTFGYVASKQQQQQQEPEEDHDPDQPLDSVLADHVLTHPELYRLELTCQCSHADDRGAEWIVATQKQTCRTCRQQKRMSLVRNNLARDLAYIDETYYEGLQPFAQDDGPADSVMDQPLEEDEDDDEAEVRAHWSKVTVGQVTSYSQRIFRSHNDGLYRGQTSLGARLAAAHQSSLVLDLSDHRLVKLNRSIGYLGHLTKLNLSNNQLTKLPKSIGYLNNLTVFNASHNQLTHLPLTMMHMSKLKAINVSHNQLTQLPANLGMLPDLMILILNNNQLTSIPSSLASLHQLISLNVGHNPLASLPAEVATIKSLRKLLTEDCPFIDAFETPLKHDPPSLLELCARQLVVRPPPSALEVYRTLPEHLQEYLMTSQPCSSCQGPYFESFVRRGRYIERLANHPVALEYRLCRAHWSDEQDRLLAMFSSHPTSPSPAAASQDATPERLHANRPMRKRAASDLSFHASLPPLPSLHLPLSARPSPAKPIDSLSSHTNDRAQSTPTLADKSLYLQDDVVSSMAGSIDHIHSLPQDRPPVSAF